MHAPTCLHCKYDNVICKYRQNHTFKLSSKSTMPFVFVDILLVNLICRRIKEIWGEVRVARYNLDQSICNSAATKRAARHVGAFYDEILAPTKLRATQHALMQQIARLASPSMTELAIVLVLDRSALSHTLRPLERDGLVVLQSEKLDRRVKRVILTEAGLAKLDRCNQLWTKAQQRFEAAVGVEQAALLRSVLDRLASVDFTRTEPAPTQLSALERLARNNNSGVPGNATPPTP
jgi:DNA-binding MarR family transcriptional regulator